MTRTKIFMPLGLAALALALFACGGGGGGGGGDGGPTQAPEDVSPPAESGPQELVVVRYDYDGDGDEDVLTLDKTTSPYTIVEALTGTATGEAVDATEALAGRPVDPAVSEALARYLAETVEIASEHELDVPTATGDLTITVFE